MIPKDIDLEALQRSLSGGEIARLISAILEGHELALAPQAASGRLNRSAQRARNQLFSALGALSKSAMAPNWSAAFARHVFMPVSSLHH